MVQRYASLPATLCLDGDPGPPWKEAQQSLTLFGPLCSGTVAHLGNRWALVCIDANEAYRRPGVYLDFLTRGDGRNVSGVADQTHFANVPL